MGERLRRLDERVLGTAARRTLPPRRHLVLALLAGLVASGVPAVYVLAADGPLVVAALLPLLALVPVALLVAAGGSAEDPRGPGV